MNMRRNIVFLRRISLRLAIVFFLVNTYAVTARAISPEITVQNQVSIDTGITFGENGLIEVSDVPVKTVVYNLKITDLEEPKAGQKLDLRAKVVSDDGYFWEIPVIWVDDTGAISYICIPGRNYRPVFAYFLPKNVVVANNIGTDTYKIKLPEFLDGILSDANALMVGSEAYGITFITTGDIADLIAPTIGNADKAKVISSLLVANDDIVGFFTGENNKALNKIKSNAEQPVIEETTESTPQEQPDNGNKGSNVTPVKNYVSIHCTDNAIENIGKGNLQALLDLIINVIEPQAVYQLNKGFPAFDAASKGKLLGEEIGLYVYDSEFDKSQEDLSGAVAYVSAMYLDEANSDYGYYIGINVDELYKQDEQTGEYKLVESEIVTLNNTLVHELMHAYMDDYNRTGMHGVVPEGAEVSSQENRFPNWFIEGVATCVDNAYTYHKDLFDVMLDDEQEVGSRVTYDSLYEYYTNYFNKDTGYASIDSEHKYYDNAINVASAYVSGYLAVMYLAAMTNDYIDSDVELIGHVKNGDYYYDSEAIRVGLDYILKKLHDGTCLDDIIDVVSNGMYSSTEDFQDSFLTVDDEGQYDASYDFCIGVLNYLDFATGELSKKNENARANGSILLAFDTAETSVIQDKLPEDMGEQENYVINDEKSFVSSTVDNDQAIESAGVKITGKDEDDKEIIDQEFIEVQVAKTGDSAKANEEDADSKEVIPEEAQNDEESDGNASTEEVAAENAVTEEKAEETTEETAAENVVAEEITKAPTAENAEADGKPEEAIAETIESEVKTEEQSEEVKAEDETKKEASEAKPEVTNEVAMLPNLIDTTIEAANAIEEQGIPKAALETISEAVAPPAGNSSEDDSESGSDDESGDGDGGNDSGGSEENGNTETSAAPEAENNVASAE